MPRGAPQVHPITGRRRVVDVACVPFRAAPPTGESESPPGGWAGPREEYVRAVKAGKVQGDLAVGRGLTQASQRRG